MQAQAIDAPVGGDEGVGQAQAVVHDAEERESLQQGDQLGGDQSNEVFRECDVRVEVVRELSEAVEVDDDEREAALDLDDVAVADDVPLVLVDEILDRLLEVRRCAQTRSACPLSGISSSITWMIETTSFVVLSNPLYSSPRSVSPRRNPRV